MINTGYLNNCRKRQQALRALYNYLNQLKIHFDLNDKDIAKILKHILKIKNKDSFMNRVWNIFK